MKKSKKFIIALICLLYTLPSIGAVSIDWWAIAAFRVRHETTKEYTDLWFNRGPGILNYTIDNTTTRVGYQLGLRFKPKENITFGLTFRSGLYGAAQVMIQDITSREGLIPAVQEAFIDWKTPYAKFELGKIPQEGNALWDLYAATLQTDFRMDDPRDGIFNDRMASLNGARISIPIEMLTLHGIYHTDFTGGYRWKNEDTAASRPEIRNPDRYVFLLGCELDVSRLLSDGVGKDIFNYYTISFDYGFPYRAADLTDIDSSYAKEKLWGANLKTSFDFIQLSIGYGYNWRDSIYTNTYTDILLSVNLFGFKPSARYQYGKQLYKFGIYDGYEIKRTAWHFYCSRLIWGVEIQPRIIIFENVLAGFKQKRQFRYEITSTIRF